MDGAQLTSIILALIGLASLGLTTYSALKLRTVAPQVTSIDNAVNNKSSRDLTLRETAEQTGETVDRIEAEQVRVADGLAEETPSKE